MTEDNPITVLLRPIHDDLSLSHVSAPWIDKMLDTVNNVITELELNQEFITQDTLGADLKNLIYSLPASKQISIINDCIVSFGRNRRRLEDKVIKDEEEELEHKSKYRKLKYNLVKYGSIIFFMLLVIFVFCVIFLSFIYGNSPDGQIADSLMNSIVQIISLIFTGNTGNSGGLM